MPLRVLLRLQGLGLELGSTVPLDDMLRPYLTQMLADRYKPAALLKEARRTLRSWQRLLGPLPDELADLAVRLRREGAKVDVKVHDPDEVDRQPHRRPDRLRLDHRRVGSCWPAHAADDPGRVGARRRRLRPRRPHLGPPPDPPRLPQDAHATAWSGSSAAASDAAAPPRPRSERATPTTPAVSRPSLQICHGHGCVTTLAWQTDRRCRASAGAWSQARARAGRPRGRRGRRRAAPR